jgi:hypothetical protein
MHTYELAGYQFDPRGWLLRAIPYTDPELLHPEDLNRTTNKEKWLPHRLKFVFLAVHAADQAKTWLFEISAESFAQ